MQITNQCSNPGVEERLGQWSWCQPCKWSLVPLGAGLVQWRLRGSHEHAGQVERDAGWCLQAMGETMYNISAITLVIVGCRCLTNDAMKDEVENKGGHIKILTRGILISQSLRYPILHAPKFCHLVHWFQNCFCFCSTTFPSHVGTIFRLQWEFQWENDQNK